MLEILFILIAVERKLKVKRPFMGAHLRAVECYLQYNIMRAPS